MNTEVKNALKTIKTFLGMEVKLEQMKLADGQTIIEADSFIFLISYRLFYLSNIFIKGYFY